MDTSVNFRLIRYNARRKMRREPAVEFLVCDGEEKYTLWMNVADIKRNILEFGAHEDLLRGVKCYKKNKFITIGE